MRTISPVRSPDNACPCAHHGVDRVLCQRILRICPDLAVEAARVGGPRVSESQLAPKILQRDRRVFTGKLSEKAHEIGIIPEQFDLDLKIA
jgi:hypothetical protein